ncbi:MAG: peptidylprolyl isomerase [Clostridiaceae bacterium]
MKKTFAVSATVFAVLLLLLCGCQTTDTAITVDGTLDVMSVGGYTISGEAYQYWVLPYRYDYENTYGTDFWNTANGKELGSEILNYVNNAIINRYALLSLADEMAFQLGEMEVSDLKAGYEAEKAQYGDSFAAYLEDNYLHEVIYYQIVYLEDARIDAFWDYLYNESDLFTVSEQETEEYAEQQAYCGVRQIMIRNDAGEDAAENLETADNLLTRLKNGEDFQTLMAEFSESTGQAVSPEGWTLSLNDENYADYFLEALSALNPGEISEVIPYEDDWQSWYLIIQRTLPDMDTVAYDLKTSKINAYLENYKETLSIRYCDVFDAIQIDDVVWTDE